MESLLVNEVAVGAAWEESLCISTMDRDHINIREVRAYAHGMSRQAASCPCSRPVYLQDSLVSLGAMAKGRSPSRPLNEELRVALPDIVGYDNYLGGSLPHVPQCGR